ncbi:hypothetical protein MASR2M117_01960 [Paludibacter sp.]
MIQNRVSSQTFEEYKKQQESEMQKFAEKQIEGMAKLQKEYADYVLQRDKEWTDYLQKEWENYQTFAGMKVPERPKPKEKPTYTASSELKSATVIQTNTTHKDAISVFPPIVEVARKPADDKRNYNNVSFRFFGRNISITCDSKLTQITFSTVNQTNIASFWEKASATSYTASVDMLLQSKSDMNINDFGYLLLTSEFAKKLYPSNENLSRLMTWFLMVRSGYGLRVAYQDQSVALLLPSLQEIYQLSYLTFGGINYYVYPKLNAGSYYTYDKDYLKSGRQIDFNISSPINFGGRKADKTITYKFEDKSYDIQVSHDPDLIEFYKNYPLVNLSVYFNAAASVQAKESLVNSIKPIVMQMDEDKAVSFILNFVQSAFPYKTDPEQFGREKFFFADEMFYYPFSDCEDRSVLFTYLVRETLGLKVLGLEYSDHVAAAVAFNTPITGDYFVYDGTKYFITDPTYINAPIGMSMPQYKTVSPLICKVNNKNAEDYNLEKVWELAQKDGFYKGSIRKNSKLLPDGRTMITGYFSQNGNLGGVNLNGSSQSHSCFVAKIDKTGQAVWAKSLTSYDGNAVGMSIETAPNGNVIVAGVYTGTIRTDGKSISSAKDKADLFIASYSPSGNLLWLNKGGLEVLPDSFSTAFSAVFNSNGSRESLKHSDEQMGEYDQGLYINNQGNIYYNGMTNNALALAGNEKNVSFASAEALDVVALLELETQKFVEKQTDKAMAGLMAGIKLVRYMNISLTGDKMKEAINKKDPNFSKTCPNIYKNLGKINFVKNSKGVITIQTDGGSDISFDKVKITNNSTIAISELQNGDYKIDVLSGIKVGKLVVWFNLNYIKMFAKKGDLLFDYSTDNSQTTVNVQKDILN